MKIRIMIMMVCVLVFTSVAFAQKGNGGTAVPAMTIQFDGGSCTATFVRSASGIINETSRTCSFFGYNNVKIQFRPIGGTPNSACDPDGLLVAPFTFGTTDFSATETGLLKYFVPGVRYNVCSYLEQSTQSGTIDSSIPDGSNATLPANGKYSVCVIGTYSNDGINVADAEYVSVDGWASNTNGLEGYWSILGEGFGDVQIRGAFVNWGDYSDTHRYCTTINGTKGESLNLRVFDGDSNTDNLVEGWYNDNSGSLNYTVKFLGY